MGKEQQRDGPADLLHSIAENIRLHDKERAEQAVAFVLEHAEVTYSEAADRYRVGIQQVRGRIISRWGSLAAARAMTEAQRQDRPRVNIEMWTRPCLRCRSTEPRPKGQYMCDRCGAACGGVHEGAV